MQNENTPKKGFDFSIAIPTVIVVLVACIVIVTQPAATKNFMDAIFSFVTGTFGWLYIGFVICCFILVGYFAFGKYAHKKLGEGKPERSTFSWLAMLFANASSAALVYWAVVEFYYYLETPPFGVEPFSNQAMTWASAYGPFHWGIVPFSMYGALAVLFGVMIHVRKVDACRISTACSSVIGEKNARGILGKVIDGFYLVCILITISGVSLGLSTPLVGTLVEAVFGIPHTLLVDGVLIVLWTIFFSITVYTGLKKGIKYISLVRTSLAFFLLGYAFLLGPTSFILSNTLQSIGTQFQYFVQMTTYTDVTGGSGFPQGWTVFYFAWFLTTALQGGLYCGRLSKGRTVRQTALGVVAANAVGCMMFFWFMGNYSISVYMDDPAVFSALMAQDPYQAMIHVWSQLPLPSLVLVGFFLFAFIATWTLVQGGAYTLAMVSEKGLTGEEEPGKFTRIFWCAITGILALALLFLGGLQTIKNAAILAAIPLIIISIVVLIALMKDLNKIWGGIKQNGDVKSIDADITENN